MKAAPTTPPISLIPLTHDELMKIPKKAPPQTPPVLSPFSPLSRKLPSPPTSQSLPEDKSTLADNELSEVVRRWGVKK